MSSRAGKHLELFQPVSLVLREQIKSQSRAGTPLEPPSKSVTELGWELRPLPVSSWLFLEAVGPSNLTELDASGEWGKGRRRVSPTPSPACVRPQAGRGRDVLRSLLGWG